MFFCFVFFKLRSGSNQQAWSFKATVPPCRYLTTTQWKIWSDRLTHCAKATHCVGNKCQQQWVTIYLQSLSAGRRTLSEVKKKMLLNIVFSWISNCTLLVWKVRLIPPWEAAGRFLACCSTVWCYWSCWSSLWHRGDRRERVDWENHSSPLWQHLQWQGNSPKQGNMMKQSC